jgi:hypothetical protein
MIETLGVVLVIFSFDHNTLGLPERPMAEDDDLHAELAVAIAA